MKTVPNAKILADSIDLNGHRLTTFEATYHRFVHSEIMAHRKFSRNAASSRAIPFIKQVEKVLSDPAIPVEFGKNQKGMQAGEEIERADEALEAWLEARDLAVEQAWKLHKLDVHKQVVNRSMEPYTWMTTVITATDFQGFFEQRCSPLAQPEIRVVAEAMREAYNASEPALVPHGGWHTPLIQDDEDEEFWEKTVEYSWDVPPETPWSNLPSAAEAKKMVSVARCARVSYLTHDGKRSIDKDFELYERLMNPGDGVRHESPREHVATPYDQVQFDKQLGNLDGWISMRHYDECLRKKS